MTLMMVTKMKVGTRLLHKKDIRKGKLEPCTPEEREMGPLDLTGIYKRGMTGGIVVCTTSSVSST